MSGYLESPEELRAFAGRLEAWFASGREGPRPVLGEEEGAPPLTVDDPVSINRMVNRYMHEAIFHRGVHLLVRAETPMDVLRVLAGLEELDAQRRRQKR